MTDKQGESLQDRLDRIGAEAEAGEPTMTAADGRGILGEDFLGGVDPVDAVRAQRDADPLPPDGGYIVTSSEEETAEVVRRIAEDGRNGAPVKFESDANDMATLTFGPMHIDDLQSMLCYLGTPEGSASFQASLVGALAEINGEPGG